LGGIGSLCFLLKIADTREEVPAILKGFAVVVWKGCVSFQDKFLRLQEP